MRSTRCWLPYASFAMLLVTLASPAAAGTYSLVENSWNESVTLKLTDGRQLDVRYRGLLGSQVGGSDYVARYEEWRNALGTEAAPALGETLVVARAYGEPERGAFRGFVERGVLLGTADSCVHLMVTLDNSTAVRRATEESPDPVWLVGSKCWANAPSVYAVAFESGGVTLAVPATKLVTNPAHYGWTTGTSASASTGSSSGSNGGSNGSGAVAAGVLIGVLVGGLLAYMAIGAAFASAFSHALW